MLLPAMANAQHGYEDVVYLKNGSIIHGMIIEQIPNQSLKIQTADRSVFVYSFDEISKITKEPLAGKRPKVAVTNDNMKKKGYALMFCVRPGIELQENIAYEESADWPAPGSREFVGVNILNGYQFNQSFVGSIGTGLEPHVSGPVFLPFFLDLRWNIKSRRVTPFINLSSGWSFTQDDIEGQNAGTYHRGGFLIAPSAGIKLFLRPSSGLFLSIGYAYQQAQTRERFYDYSYYGTYQYTYWRNDDRQSVVLRFGYSF